MIDSRVKLLYYFYLNNGFTSNDIAAHSAYLRIFMSIVIIGKNNYDVSRDIVNKIVEQLIYD